MWPVARPGRELQLIMIIGPSGVQFSLQSYEYFQWQNRTTAKQEPNLSITRMITDRIGRHEFLLPINHNHYKFRQKRHLGQKSSSNLKISQLWFWLILVSSDEATRSITTHVPPGQDVSPSHAGNSPTLLPPPPLWHFIRLSWLISATHLYSWVKRGTVTDRIGRHEFLLPINHNHYKFRQKRHLGQKSSSNLKISQLWFWLILVSSDEATRSITTHVPPGQDVSPSHAGNSPTLLPPPPLWHFIRLSWLISATHLYSWVKRGTVRNNKVLYKNKTHNLARLQMQTSWPWVHLTNHKATISPQEGRVYVESL